MMAEYRKNVYTYSCGGLTQLIEQGTYRLLASFQYTESQRRRLTAAFSTDILGWTFLEKYFMEGIDSWTRNSHNDVIIVSGRLHTPFAKELEKKIDDLVGEERSAEALELVRQLRCMFPEDPEYSGLEIHVDFEACWEAGQRKADEERNAGVKK